MTPLDGETLDDITRFVANIKQFDGQKARFEVAAADAVHNHAAPHYLLGYSEENDSAFANVGYVMQKADLYMQSLALGSVWLGMAAPKNKKGFCILIAFGKTNVPQRKSPREFDRLPINEISDKDNAVAKAARLAPSAMNSQPWKLHFEDGKITAAYFGRGLMKPVLKKKLSKIDLGIVTRHIEIALLNEGKEIVSINPKTNNDDFRIEIMYK
jgi:hypothetical protein